MPKKITYPPAKCKYPWSAWAGQKEGVTLEAGKDFHVAIRVMRIAALGWANRKGYTCATQIVNETTLKVKFNESSTTKAKGTVASDSRRAKSKRATTDSVCSRSSKKRATAKKA